MAITTWAMTIWACGFAANGVLAVALLYKRRWAVIPVFAAFTLFNLIRTAMLYTVRTFGTENAYFWMYWSLAFVDYVLQIALIAELGGLVLGPFPASLARTRRRVPLVLGTSALVAAMVCMTLAASSMTVLERWDMRLSVFTSLLVCQCYLFLLKTAERLALQWNAHALAIGNGFVLFNAVALANNGFQAARGWTKTYPSYLLDRGVRSIYICVVVYWTVALWRSERRQTTLDEDASACSQVSVPVIALYAREIDTESKAS